MRSAFVGRPAFFCAADHQVPFVDDDDDGAPALVRVAGDGGIELAHAFGGVDDQQGNVGGFQMLARHHHRKLFRHQVSLAFAADAGGVDEAKRLAVVLDDFVDGIARGAGDRARRWRGRTGQAVQQRRFADVGMPDDGDS